MKLYAAYFKSGDKFVSSLFQADTQLVALRNFKFIVNDAVKNNLCMPQELQLLEFADVIHWNDNCSECAIKPHETMLLASGDEIDKVYKKIYRDTFGEELKLDNEKPVSESEAEFVGGNVK